MSAQDWADEIAAMIVAAHINTWALIEHSDNLKSAIAAALRAVKNGSLGRRDTDGSNLPALDDALGQEDKE